MKSITKRGTDICKGIKTTKIYTLQTQKMAFFVTQFCGTRHLVDIKHQKLVEVASNSLLSLALDLFDFLKLLLSYPFSGVILFLTVQ